MACVVNLKAFTGVPVGMFARSVAVSFLLIVAVVGGTTAAPDGEPREGFAGAVPASEAHPYVGATAVVVPAGHVRLMNGLALLGARDAFWWNPDAGLYQHVGGLICQVPPGASPCPPVPPHHAGDPSYRVFCGGITLRAEFWSPAKDTVVWVGYDRLGSTGPVGYGVWCEQPRPPTVGHVWHWPV